MSNPLAVMLITNTTIFVGGRWRYSPGAAAAVNHEDVARIEHKAAALGGNRFNIVRRDGKRLTFTGADVTDLFREHGWPVERLA